MNRSHTPEDVEKIQSGWRKRQIQMQITMDDDDIQEYVRPWVGLTEEERKEIWNVGEKKDQALRALLIQAIRDIEAKLKEKNT
jgi:hypothetical protein